MLKRLLRPSTSPTGFAARPGFNKPPCAVARNQFTIECDCLCSIFTADDDNGIADINTSLLRKAFRDLTALFLKPFTYYVTLSGLPPPGVQSLALTDALLNCRLNGTGSKTRWNPYLDPPSLPRFSEEVLTL